MSIWDAMATSGTQVTFGPGDVLMRHGDATRQCYAIREGEVLVTATSTAGATLVLARRGPGAVVGEFAALDGTPRSATVTAETDVVAQVLQVSELEQVLMQHPEVAVVEIRRLARQLRELTERYAVRSEELRLRVMQLLETNAAESGSPVFRSTREELAGWVGATREAVSRTLKDLETEGVVALRRGAVELVVDRA